MGGDYAPQEVVAGALTAGRELGVEVILVGDQDKIKVYTGRADVEIVHASEVIGMEEQPVLAVRRKRNASLVRAIKLVKEGTASAVVSAGNTGAIMAASLLELGCITGIDRPALAGLFPNVNGYTVILDIGANVDCRPHHLLQFAIIGSAYAKTVLGISSPRIGLLNIGEEGGKGNELTRRAYLLLRESTLNFIGNVEGYDLFNGRVDVVVCDGFIGNIVLKTTEGLVMALRHMLEKEIKCDMVTEVAASMKLVSLNELWKQFDCSKYGGVPLLGINGVVVVSHGGSRSYAIRNAINVAKEAVESNLVTAIASSLDRVFLEGVSNND